MAKRDDLAKPEGLTPDGERAYQAVVGFLRRKRKTHTGGCRAFYTPEEWAARGEQFGRAGVLVIAHDGGDLAQVFNLDYERYGLNGQAVEALRAAGFFYEQCTSWYSAVYATGKPTVERPRPQLPPLPADAPAAIAAARALWTKRCAEFLAEKGDQGSCVLGAGIVRDERSDEFLIEARAVTQAQGSVVWETSVEEVLALLRQAGIACHYHCGVMD